MHKWVFTLIATRDGLAHSGRLCERCGAAHRAIFRTRLVGWEAVDEKEKI
jgi:hypothetical protein